MSKAENDQPIYFLMLFHGLPLLKYLVNTICKKKVTSPKKECWINIHENWSMVAQYAEEWAHYVETNLIPFCCSNHA